MCLWLPITRIPSGIWSHLNGWIYGRLKICAPRKSGEKFTKIFQGMLPPKTSHHAKFRRSVKSAWRKALQKLGLGHRKNLFCHEYIYTYTFHLPLYVVILLHLKFYLSILFSAIFYNTIVQMHLFFEVIVTDATASVTITQVAQKLHRASLNML